MSQVQFARMPGAHVPPLRRGACPSLAAPMQTGDGLLARLRARSLSPYQLGRIAELAARHGNGLVEVTARGNLQIRGLTPESTAPFAEAIEAVVDVETGLPIDLSPLAGLDPSEPVDPRPIAEAIHRLADPRRLTERLGPKVSVVIHAGGSIGLGTIGADIRLVWIGDGWQLAIAGSVVDTVTTDRAAEAVIAVLEEIAALGPDGRGRDLARSGPAPAMRISEPSFRYRLTENITGLRIALPFGSADSAALVALSALRGITAFLPAPDRAFIALVPDSQADEIRALAATLGFMVGPDPRNNIAACIGSAGCASGHLPARLLAGELAAAHPDFFDGSLTLHVSGCAKGCALPRTALLTLVGNGDDCRLVVNGRAGDDAPISFSRDRMEPTIARLAALWRDNRTLGESVAACFTRLGTARLLSALQG